MTTTETLPKKKATRPADIRAFFEAQRKTVLTLLGFSAAGYERPELLLSTASDILDRFDPKTIIVNAGATPDGIGTIYETVKARGFTTTGIVSTEAIRHEVALSPFVDRIFFVQDEIWGGFLEGGEQLSPTSDMMVAVSDIMVAIGGGNVTHDELLAARRQGKEVIFHPADMNHALAKEKARKKGLPMPKDFRGAAATLFET